MSRFVNNAMSDIRTGRESWRVFVFLGLPSCLLSIAAVALHSV